MRLSLVPPAMLIAFCATPVVAETRHDEQVWINATVMGTLRDSKVAYFVEVQPRFTDGAGRLGQLLLRGGLGWRFSPAVTAYAGYLHFVQPVEGGRDRNEERPFLQLDWTLPKLGAGTFSSRTRLEMRRFSDGQDTGWRLRGMVRYVHPLGAPEKVRALVYAEPFVAFNDTDWGQRGGFDQLRSFAGVEVPLEGKTTLELGYLNQLVNARGGVARVSHVASVSLFIRP